MDSPIAGVSDDEEMNEHMNEIHNEGKTVAEEKKKPSQFHSSHIQQQDLATDLPSDKAAGLSPTKETILSPIDMRAETGKRRSHSSDDIVVSAVKRLRYGLDGFEVDSSENAMEDTITVTASDGTTIDFPRIPMEEKSHAPVRSFALWRGIYPKFNKTRKRRQVQTVSSAPK